MAHAVAIPSRSSAEYRGLPFRMKRTLEELGELRSELTTDTVHDLRVALRRCRSIAAAMEEIDPHPDWREMRGCARELFRSLGELRDADVMAEWLDKLHPEEEGLKRQMLEGLGSVQKAAREKALRSAARFDGKRWKKLSRALGARMRRVPLDGDAAHCLGLERLEEAKELHRRAIRTESAKPWHALRIGVKRFRYTAEALLPTAHEEWSESLKRVQDVLGNIHDLDMLAQMLKQTSAEPAAATSVDWKTRVASDRQKNVETYRQLALGTAGIWSAWFAGFPRESWERYAEGRIRATRAAMDGKPARSGAVARLAMRIWSQLGARKLGAVFSDRKERRVLQTAARLSGIRDPNTRRAREKSARTFLLQSPVPPRWTFAEWERAAWAIRFQRGVEPGQRNKQFAKLSAEQQAKICLLAGILRLAIAAQKCGATAGSALRFEVLPQGLLLRVGGAEDSPKNAARFAAAKRLLERSLGKSILIQAEAAEGVLAERNPAKEAPLAISIVR